MGPAQDLYRGPFVRIDGRAIAYRTFGAKGSPIVLVSGFAESSWVWSRVGAILGSTHRVYALDLPPFGYSQRTGPYTLTSWAETTRDFAQHFDLVTPLIVGHSLGAAVAVTVAMDHPSDVSGIVLLDGDALSGRGGGPWLSRIAVDPFATTAYRLVTGSDWVFRRALAVTTGPDAPPASAADVRNWQRPFRVQGTIEALRELSGLGMQGYTLEQLRTLRTPATVIWGDSDTVDPIAAGQSAADALGAQLVTIPAAGHLSMISQPGAVAAAIAAASRR